MKVPVISVIALATVSKLLLPHLFAYYETEHQQLNVTADKPTAKPYYPELKFAISLLAHLQKNEPNENIFYSPNSVYKTLLMAYFCAGGETEIELKQLLLLSSETSKVDAKYAYKLKKEQQLNRFQNQSIEFNSVEKLYVHTGERVRDSVKILLKDNIEQLDFADDLEKQIKHINQFIAKTTKNNINDFLQSNSLSNETMLVMINAVYFKGQWVNVFDKGHTVRSLFYKQNGEKVYVDMMNQLAHFKYGFIENLNTRVLKMPYKDENESLSMFIFMPDASSTAIAELLDKLSPEILDDVFNGHRSVYRPTYINANICVSLPAFSFKSTIDLSSIIEQHMEVDTLFQYANLSDIFESTKRRFKSKLDHMAKIKIDEVGAVAAAGTYLNAWPASACQTFVCNHPFLFVIHDRKFNEILFAGIYQGSNV